MEMETKWSDAKKAIVWCVKNLIKIPFSVCVCVCVRDAALRSGCDPISCICKANFYAERKPLLDSVFVSHFGESWRYFLSKTTC